MCIDRCKDTLHYIYLILCLTVRRQTTKIIHLMRIMRGGLYKSHLAFIVPPKIDLNKFVRPSVRLTEKASSNCLIIIDTIKISLL